MLLSIWAVGAVAGLLTVAGALAGFAPSGRTARAERLLTAGCATAALGLCAASFAVG